MEQNKINVVDAKIGNPYLMIEKIYPYMSNIPYSKSLMSYQFEYDPKIEQLIRDYYHYYLQHPLSQNQKIIYGLGTTQCFASLIYAISKAQSNKSLWIDHINPLPSYGIYKETTKSFNGYHTYTIAHNQELLMDYESDKLFSGYYRPILQNNPDIMVGISPNNPTGKYLSEEDLTFQTRHSIKTSSCFMVIDDVYDKPLFNKNYHKDQIIQNMFENSKRVIKISSMSKYGIPSARFGWFITEDPQIASYGFEYFKKVNNGTCIPTYECGKTLYDNVLIKKPEFTPWIYNTLQNRMYQLTNILTKKNIEFIKPNYTSPYIFTKMNSQEWLEKYNIISRPSEDFLMKKNQGSRINCMLETKDWNQLIQNLLTN